ncbi:Hypothetical protein CAP_4670 [Chondromyces apiculatus DSM 436]|uniref:Uncharacterized protein n=1 Tax=Chondromyces apiculatus DSM 436 TaxID=1192034 RepID=A0A017T4K9_9BACT|nr:Hypothetical protein CAP_4670 [Chondromyces apiculatus DSM 436]
MECSHQDARERQRTKGGRRSPAPSVLIRLLPDLPQQVGRVRQVR